MNRNIRILTGSAMLVAIGVVLSLFRIPISMITEITLTSLPIALGGYLFGPAAGAAIGALIDVGGFFIAPKGAFFPGFTVSTALIGLIYSLFLYRVWWSPEKEGRRFLRTVPGGLFTRIAVSHLLKTLLISLFLNCFWLAAYYGMPFAAVLVGSIPKEAVNFPVEVLLIYSVIRLAERLHLFMDRPHKKS